MKTATDVRSELVFQYGSNMSTTRLRDRIREARPLEAAWTVERYEFTFPVWSIRHNRAACGIMSSEAGRVIFGALYEIPDDLICRSSGRPGRRTLDAIEGEGANTAGPASLCTVSLREEHLRHLPTFQ